LYSNKNEEDAFMKKWGEKDFKELYMRAHEAGMEAASRVQVRPMVVYQRANPLDDTSPVTRTWYVEDGVCGFAWITIKPANSKFAKWLIQKGYARHAYGGGVSIWVSLFNQSMQRKEAYAYAFAEVLRNAGIRAYAGSRMD